MEHQSTTQSGGGHRSQLLKPPNLNLDTDGSDADGLSTTQKDGRSGPRSHSAAAPSLFHKVKDTRSILSLLVSESQIFGGTQGGEILVWSLRTYEETTRFVAHNGAVLGLHISPDSSRLFSCAGDAIVNVWCTRAFNRIYSIYSTFDVGDVFCVAYSSELDTVFIGAQNTSLQWYDLSQKDSVPRPDLGSHPSQRSHRFFDSKGPGGVSTPRSEAPELIGGGQLLEISSLNYKQYAHYGYVYCMLLAKGLTQGDSDEETLITGGGDGSIKLWQLKRSTSGISIQNFATLANDDNSVLAMARKDTLLYAGKLEGEVNTWDLDTRQLIQTVKAYNGVDVLSLAVGFDCLFTGGANGQAKIFERHKRLADWKAHDQLILAATVTEYNGKPYLVTGGNDDCVAIWDLAGVFDSKASISRASNEQLVQSLGRFISYRTVSSNPEYAEDCRQGASWLRNLFKRFGAQTELLKTGHDQNPIVYACFKGKSTRGKRILFYGHYDVVSAEYETSKWKSEPFSLQGRDGFLYGRGVTDNKGPVLAAAYAVADLITEQKLETDVVFLIEGEEERGSRGFDQAVKQNKNIVGHISWILVANSYWLNDDFPCLTYGLRGVVHATIGIEGGAKDLHSGVNGSSLMNEPLKDLVSLLATLADQDSHVNIPHFYDKILPETLEEAERYDNISRRLSRTSSRLEDPESLRAKWREPSFTIHGFTTSSAGVSTVIPHAASAAVSFRLVPEQDAEEISEAFTKFIEKQFLKLGTSNKLSIKLGHPVDPWLGDPNNKMYQTLEQAVIDVWALDKTLDSSTTSPNLNGTSESRKDSTVNGRAGLTSAPHKPLYIREGGSIPAIRFLEKEFGAPAAQLPCGQASDNAHLENERLRLTNLYNSREIFKKVFQELPAK